MTFIKHLRGTPVTLIQRIETERDSFDHPIYEGKEVTVENVLASPISSGNVLSTTNPYGRKTVYAFGIPKGDKHTWEDNKAKFFGRTFRVLGKGTRGIDDPIPPRWNKKVWVGVHE